MNVRIVHVHTGAIRVGVLGSDGGKSCFDIDAPLVTLHFGNMIGAREFNYNHGYGHAFANSKEAPIRDWRIHPDDLAEIRQKAKEQGKKVKPCGKSPGRPKQPKRGKPAHPRQMSFGDPK